METVVGSRRTTRVAIIGAGAIGSAVAARLAAGALPGVMATGFLVRDPERQLPLRAYADLDALLDDGPDVVVEAAGREAMFTYAEGCLRAGKDLAVLSGGALGDETLSRTLSAACEASGARMLLPSGAIGGLDVLRAAAEDTIEEVTVEQRKPPRVLLDEPEASSLQEEYIVFDGSVADAVSLYPRSTNVAAAVALAGIGFQRTRARVVADPALTANVAIVTAKGSFGILSIRLENVPSVNPRTSAIVADSVIACLRRRRAALVVPA